MARGQNITPPNAFHPLWEDKGQKSLVCCSQENGVCARGVLLFSCRDAADKPRHEVRSHPTLFVTWTRLKNGV